jgi:hypothetical protein
MKDVQRKEQPNILRECLPNLLEMIHQKVLLLFVGPDSSWMVSPLPLKHLPLLLIKESETHFLS